MSERCPDIRENITKLSFPGENLGFANDADGTDNKDDFLNFSFDHMYACNSDNSDVNSDRQAGESEVRHLRDLLMLHLDLIQQQSDDIVNRDKYIAELKVENETLRQRLERMERRVSSQNNCTDSYGGGGDDDAFQPEHFPNDMTHDTGFCADTEDSKDDIKVMGIRADESNYPVASDVQRRNQERDRDRDRTADPSADKRSNDSSSTFQIKQELVPSDAKTDDTELPDVFPDSTTVSGGRFDMPENHGMPPKDGSRHFALRPGGRRKRLCSNSSQLSANDSLTSVNDHRKKRKSRCKSTSALTVDSPYVTLAGETDACDEPDDVDVDAGRQTMLEVPRWRIKVYTSCYSMEGTENLDDEVYNKRHLRLENDERRRKRWDVQRIREQRHIERLKQRQERIGSGSKNEEINEPPPTFWPSVQDVRFIEIADELPVSAFGSPIPKLTPSEFQLPWMNGAVPLKKSRTRKSSARQKTHRR